MRKKLTTILIISLILVCILQISSFAVIDQAKLFISTEISKINTTNETMVYAAQTFKKLGYDVQPGTAHLNYTITGLKKDVLNYISGTGNNYALFVYAHGGTGVFTMDNTKASEVIYTSNISGYWHFVFLNSCSCMSNDAFAQAFKTVGYSNRASLGWYDTVQYIGTYEWWSHFKDFAGKENLRDACLDAASLCEHSTPIRMYGDKTWYGYAWDK